MNLDDPRLLYFGVVTVIIEWIGTILALVYWKGFDPNKAVSIATSSAWPLPLIFGLTLTLAGITYAIFGLALGKYHKHIPYFAVLGGIAFALTGWIRFTGNGGFTDSFHLTCSYLALISYLLMVRLLRSHPKQPVSVASKVIFWLMCLSVAIATLSIYVVHRYFGYIELLILVLAQIWTLFVVWHERKDIKKPDNPVF